MVRAHPTVPTKSSAYLNRRSLVILQSYQLATTRRRCEMNQLKSLMVTLRNLSRRPDAGSSDCIGGAKLAIWKCNFEELGEVDREPFLRELRKQANDEEKGAPDEQVKLFWRDVAQYEPVLNKPPI